MLKHNTSATEGIYSVGRDEHHKHLGFRTRAICRSCSFPAKLTTRKIDRIQTPKATGQQQQNCAFLFGGEDDVEGRSLIGSGVEGMPSIWIRESAVRTDGSVASLDMFSTQCIRVLSIEQMDAIVVDVRGEKI